MSLHYRPMESFDDWQTLHPEKHWKSGYSAQCLAKSWGDAKKGFPKRVKQALDSASDPRLHNLEILAGFGEYKTPLPGGSRASHTDLLVVARSDESLVVIGVEGKCQESFSTTLGKWEGSQVRLDFLQSLLPGAPQFDEAIRYQLLHRCAAAAIEAERYHAPIAVMLVHQFGGDSDSWGDFTAFATVFGQSPERGDIIPLGTCENGVDLFVGWVGE